ncbi:glycosyltransferase family protein [Tsuneonella flava]|uniref:Glycosyltransferase family protein n=1 Tax=Tsuneonella flava TaxID=2055955 RepID=A0ABX7KBZ9_9SPHN|nr:tetratricopeptide repeat-containing glycosyltransferase family protein [Tsuneonella flava]QSB45529.1 glycosyltransferase family protein [Tsuneonella flava]
MAEPGIHQMPTCEDALAALNNGDRARCGELAVAILAQDPDNGLAHMLRDASLTDEWVALATAHCAAACRNSPLNPQAWVNRAMFYERVDRHDKALDCSRRALALDPLHIDALAVGTQNFRVNELFDEAIALAERLRQIAPDHPSGYTNAAIALQYLERYEEADPMFALATEMVEDRGPLDWEHFHSLLARQHFAEAWPKYETRFKPSVNSGVTDFPFDCPRWSGAGSDHVLVYGEQGLGDQIMFASAIADLQANCAQVTLAVHEILAGLFRASFPGVSVVTMPVDSGVRECADVLARAGAVRKVDSVLAIGSLMSRFRNRRDVFPGTPYLRPSEAARDFWRRRPDWAEGIRQVRGQRALRVGICWACNPSMGRFAGSMRARHKTMALAEMLRLVDIDGVVPVAITNVPLTAFEGGEAVAGRVIDISADLLSLDRTAAVLEQLDLLVTVDTGVAHLAGAMGVPVWILLNRRGDYRWGEWGAQSSYWYDSARLYWQDTLGDWTGLVDRVRQDLVRTVEQQRVGECA